MANIVPFDKLNASHLPAKMRARIEQGLIANQNFADNIRDAYPTLSIKGKVFRFRQSGSEQPHVDERGYPMNYLDVILVNASPDIAKSYYEKGYTEGDMDLPKCWSLDSIKPHPSVPEKVNPVCQTCPMNQFGSRITEAGKQAKACQDQRRVAITLPHHLESDNPVPVLMRVPQSSLKGLKKYADDLSRIPVDVGAVVTRLSFEPLDAFPRLKFEYAGVLTDDEYDIVVDLAEDQTTVAMLSSPISEPAEENLTEEQKLRTPHAPQQAAPQRAAPQRGNVTPFPPAQQAAPAAAPARAAPTPQPAAQARPAPAAAQPATQAKVVGGIVDLGGKFYNPVTQEFCNPDGSPLGSAPQVAPQVEAQAEPEPEEAPAPVTSGPAPRQRRTRAAAGGAAAAPEGTVQAAAPALDKLLSDLLPR